MAAPSRLLLDREGRKVTATGPVPAGFSHFGRPAQAGKAASARARVEAVLARRRGKAA